MKKNSKMGNIQVVQPLHGIENMSLIGSNGIIAGGGETVEKFPSQDPQIVNGSSPKKRGRKRKSTAKQTPQRKRSKVDTINVQKEPEDDPSQAFAILITPRSNPVVEESAKKKRIRRDSIFKLPTKKFHKAGFHVDETDVGMSEASTISSTCSSVSSSSPPRTANESEQPEKAAKPLLRPPVYFEGAMTKVSDFILPYDCYLHKVEMKETMYVGKNYRKIKQNIFVDVKPQSEIEDNRCDCKPPPDGKEGCGSFCLNRCMLIECDPNHCPCKDKCSNQRMKKSKWAPGLERFMTRNRGWGVRTTEKIKEGDFILEYIGEIVSMKLFAERMVNMYHNDANHYCLSLGPNIVIDGYRAANEGRFVNHSCEPNCVMQKWSVDGYYRMGLFANRDIEPGEELSYDYNFDSYNSETQQVCKCGSKNCRGVLGGRSKGNDRRSSVDVGKNKKGGRKRRRRRPQPKIRENGTKNGVSMEADTNELKNPMNHSESLDETAKKASVQH